MLNRVLFSIDKLQAAASILKRRKASHKHALTNNRREPSTEDGDIRSSFARIHAALTSFVSRPKPENTPNPITGPEWGGAGLLNANEDFAGSASLVSQQRAGGGTGNAFRLSHTRQQLIVWLLWNACIRDQKNPVAFFQWCNRLYR